MLSTSQAATTVLMKYPNEPVFGDTAFTTPHAERSHSPLII